MQNAPVKSKNRLIMAFRKWHTWFGVAAGLFIVIAGFSGIILNYKKPIFSVIGLEKGMEESKEKSKSKALAEFSTQTGFGAATITPDRALLLSRAQWGNVPLERIELKSEHGQLIYKIKQSKGEELWVNATTGASFVKREYEKMKPGPGGVAKAQFDWGKLILDLHTGKLGGEIGKALMSVAALILLFLTSSGIYLWIKPILNRRQTAKTKEPAVIEPKGASLALPLVASKAQ